MRTKLTSEEIDRICAAESKMEPTIVVIASSILAPQEEDTSFLIGLASGLLAIVKAADDGIPDHVMMIIATMVRECAIEVQSRRSTETQKM